MKKIPLSTLLLIVSVLVRSIPLQSAELPLLQISDIKYEGAFRLPAATYGSSSLNYSEGPIEYNGYNNSIFIAGHAHHQNIAEFAVPGIVKSNNLTDLPMAPPPLQSFSPILN